MMTVFSSFFSYLAMQVDYPDNTTFMKQRAKIRDWQNTVEMAQLTRLTCSESVGGDGTSERTFSMKDAS